MIAYGISNWRQKWSGLVYKYACLTPLSSCFLLSLYSPHFSNVQVWLILDVSFHLLYTYERDITTIIYAYITNIPSSETHICKLVDWIKYAIYKPAISAPTTLL